jgi:hypothetical protein
MMIIEKIPSPGRLDSYPFRTIITGVKFNDDFPSHQEIEVKG